ncbi:MAG: GNAT family N-acetyltransferase [Chloroflexota bacterium]|nr:MAG: hypothetical protein DIU80_10210 [Chloroflexota bacterium]
MLRIRTYDGERDAGTLIRLWHAIFTAEWPLPAARAERLLSAAEPPVRRDVLLAEEAGDPTGLAIVDHDLRPAHGERAGNLVALAVVPGARRRGVGTALHTAALARLAESGARNVQLGGGAPRLWPGVPSTARDAVAFFASQGWTFAEQSHDMVQDLRRYATPPEVYERAAAQGVAAGLVSPERLPALLDFVEREFPEWAGDYRSIVDLGDRDDLLEATDASGRTLGALVMYTPRSHPGRSDVVWTELLGADCGALGDVGVAEDARRRGVGSLLVARGSEILRERGAGNCLIAWTWALEFYGKLGYRLWRSYEMSWREIAPSRRPDPDG